MATVPSGFQIGAKVTPATAAANYTKNAGNAGTWWATKYLMSKTDPFAAASAASGRWLARLNEVGEAGFKKGLANVDKNAVGTMVSTKGAGLYNAGIANKGSAKYAKVADQLIPALQGIAANLPPRGTLEDNIARAAAMARGAAAIRGQYRA